MSEQTVPKKSSGKRLGLIIGLSVGAVVILIIVIAGIGISKLAQNFGLPMEVETPEYNDISSVINTSGIVTSGEVTTYTAPISATINEVLVRPGQTIKSGDPILSFDTSELENQYTQASLSARSTELNNQSTIEASNKINTQLTQARQEADSLRGQIKALEQEIADLQNSMGDVEANDLITAIWEKRSQLSFVLEEIQALIDSNPAGSNINENPEYLAKCAERDSLISSINNLEAISSSSPDVSDSILQLITAKSSELATLQAQLASQEALIENAEAGILTATQREQLSIASQLSSLQVEAAATSLEEGKAGIIAQQSGIITSVDVTNGSAAMPGYPLFTIANTNDLKVVVSLTKNDLETVALGQSATVTILGKDYKGEVTYISRMATTDLSGNTAVEAEVTIQNPDDSIILGLEAKVVIHTASVSDVLTIPNYALNVDKTGTFVYAVEDNVIVKKYITTGISDIERCEVLDGITEDTMIIVNVTAGVEEGLPVNPILPQENSNGRTTDQSQN